MHSPDIDLVRAASAAPEIRADQEGDGDTLGTLTGHFSVFNTWYQVESMWEGEFLERVAPGTFTQTIVDDLDRMRVLFDHGYDPTIGNKVLGQIESLAEDKTGPAYEVPLFDTTYNRDLLPGLRKGAYGSSFRFRVQAEEWDDEPKASKANPKGLPERTITRAKVMEFGPVTFPANPAATAGMRSLTDQFYDRLRQRDTQAYDTAVRAAGITVPGTAGANDLTGRPARGAGGGDSDPTQAAAAPGPDPYDDPELRDLLLRYQGVIRDRH